MSLLEQEVKTLKQQVAELQKQLGAEGNLVGGFAEGLAEDSIETYLFDHYGMLSVSPNFRARHQGKSLEIDMLGEVNGQRNEVVAVEIKASLTQKSVSQLQEIIKQIPLMIPRLKGAKIKGLIVAAKTPPSTVKQAKAAGFDVAKMGCSSLRPL